MAAVCNHRQPHFRTGDNARVSLMKLAVVGGGGGWLCLLGSIHQRTHRTIATGVGVQA